MKVLYQWKFLTLFLLTLFALNSNAQILLRTNTDLYLSAVSIDKDLKNFDYAEYSYFEETLNYRKRYNKYGGERSVYTIFSVYKKFNSYGVCPYGLNFDIMSERFNKNKANTFRYWNKIRMSLKLLIEKNVKDPTELPINYFIPEMNFSFLHIPHSARGDQRTKSRKGSFMFIFTVTPTKRILTCMKFNVGSVWIVPYFKQEAVIVNNMKSFAGLDVAFEINKNGYDRNRVESSKDIYRGITLTCGPEYNLSVSRIIFNIGLSISTENH